MNDYPGGSNGWLSRVLSVLGFALIAISVVSQYIRGDLAVWAQIVCLTAGVAWMLLVVVRIRGPRISLVWLAVMSVGGAITGPVTDGTSLVIAVIAVLVLTRDLRRPIGWGVGLGVITMFILLGAEFFTPLAPLAEFAMQAGVVVGFLAGSSRRQFVLADIRARELVEEQARTDVLAARAQLAHDIHDVLAHSLGGLVIQLDAVDALLESGEFDAAAARVRDARALAAEGMGEARRAVAALSAGVQDQPVAGRTVIADIEALIQVHRSLGGNARLEQRGAPIEVSALLATALRRAVQEGLTNARKHAPEAHVTVSLAWGSDGVDVAISNPLVTSARPNGSDTSTGGGHGLVGMRERFSQLPGGSMTAGVAGERFVVTAHAATPRPAQPAAVIA